MAEGQVPSMTGDALRQVVQFQSGGRGYTRTYEAAFACIRLLEMTTRQMFASGYMLVVERGIETKFVSTLRGARAVGVRLEVDGSG